MTCYDQKRQATFPAGFVDVFVDGFGPGIEMFSLVVVYIIGILITSWFMKQSPHNWVVFHPLNNKTGPFFIAHMTGVDHPTWGNKTMVLTRSMKSKHKKPWMFFSILVF